MRVRNKAHPLRTRILFHTAHKRNDEPAMMSQHQAWKIRGHKVELGAWNTRVNFCGWINASWPRDFQYHLGTLMVVILLWVMFKFYVSPMELAIIFSWLEIRHTTGFACHKELPPRTPKPQVLSATQIPPLSGCDKIQFLRWCSKHHTKRMCTELVLASPSQLDSCWLPLASKNWSTLTYFNVSYQKYPNIMYP